MHILLTAILFNPMEIISRKEAQLAGLKQYYTGKPCTHGHFTYRYTSSGTCAQCVVDASGKSKQVHVQSRSALDDSARLVALQVAASREQRQEALQSIVVVNVPIARHDDLLLVLDTAKTVTLARSPALLPGDLVAGQRANKDAPLYKVKVHSADSKLIMDVADALYKQHSRPVEMPHVARLAALQADLNKGDPVPDWANKP